MTPSQPERADLPAVPFQTEGAAGHSDALIAVRNAAKLGGSLVVTWGIALAVRLLMPRFLGPEAWGPLNFSDAFAATFFVALSLGIDTYIRREVSIRPDHASDLMAGVTLVRVVTGLLLLLVMQLVLVQLHRPPEVRALVFVFGLAAFVSAMNMTFAALLHARGTVDGLSVLNIVTKIIWGGGTFLTLLLHWPLVGIPTALLVAEVVKLLGSARLAQGHLQLRWQLSWAPLWVALVASLPLFLNTASHTIYNKLDVTILAVVAGDKEVAWYGASSLLAGLTLLIAPMFGWVLLPLFAKARAHSEERYTQTLRRSLEAVLTFAFPTALLMALGADLWVSMLYGAAYAPAAPSLRILSPLFVLTYVAMLHANSLILTGRAWAQAFVSLSGLAVNPLLNWLFIPLAVGWFGVGGAGRAAALAQLGTELVVTSMMVALVGARAFDRRSMQMIVRTLAVCAAVWVLDFSLQGTVAIAPRIAIDALAYAVLLLGSGAIQVRETIDFARSALRRPTAGRRGVAVLALASLSLAGCYRPGGVWVPVDRYQAAASADYLVGPGDVLQVTVFQQEAMSARVRVRADGKVSLPLVGECVAAGKSPPAFAAELAVLLREFVNKPSVRVSLEEARPLLVAVAGEVLRPGTVTLEPQAGVLAALAAAGGLTDFGHRGGIFVLRPATARAPAARLLFTWEALTRGVGAATSFALLPGDVVVVE